MKKINPFSRLKAYLRYRKAVIKADEAHLSTGERYYVMPLSHKKKTLIVLDRTRFRYLKRKGYIPRRAITADLERECFYCTPYANGTCQLSQEYINIKRKQYYQWYEKSL